MPDDPGSTSLIIFFVLTVAISAFVNLGKSAAIASSDTRLNEDAESGNKNAKILLKMLDEPNGFLSSMKIALTVPQILLALLVGEKLCGKFASVLRNLLGVGEIPAKIIVFAVSTLVLTFVMLVFGEFVPKRIGLKNPEKTAYSMAGALLFLERIFIPLCALCSFFTKTVLKIFGINADEEPKEATEENIRMMLDEGNENGTIEESEKEMINNIFEFDDRTVGEIMTHRTEMTAVEMSALIGDAVDLAISDGYSRIPVYDETIDNIKGIIYAKDLLTLIGDENITERRVTDFIRPVNFIPESNSCREAFMEFQQKKIQVAIVVDEYGGTAGLVSMEDLIESVMGNIQDEYDNEEEEFSKIDADNFDFDGSVLLDDIEDILDIKFSEDLDYDTLGGLILDLLGRIPEENENPSVTYKNIEFTVEKTEEHRIERVHARRLPKEETEE